MDREYRGYIDRHLRNVLYVVLTGNRETVQCEVLTAMGRLYNELLTCSGQIVQCELLTDSGQSVQCEVLTGSGKVYSVSYLQAVGQFLSFRY